MKVEWMDYRGKRILLEDFSHSEPGDEFLGTLQKAKAMIHAEPEKSVLALFDATEARFDQDALNEVKRFTDSNTPFIKAAAVVGIKGLLNIALHAVSRFAGRNFKMFDTREEAQAWLITQ
ncbi:viroplasmin family protein [bacterium]|nr:viroplasmin family protein [bacterium]